MLLLLLLLPLLLMQLLLLWLLVVVILLLSLLFLLLFLLLLIVNLQRTTLYAAHGEGRPLRSLSVAFAIVGVVGVVGVVVVGVVGVVVGRRRPIGIYFMHRKTPNQNRNYNWNRLNWTELNRSDPSELWAICIYMHSDTRRTYAYGLWLTIHISLTLIIYRLDRVRAIAIAKFALF